MGKINWTINGKNFDSFGIGVSASRGFGDLLKQKDRPSYNWPGQNGKQYNLDIKPKYEERTIELDCFVIGNDWNMMEDQFRSFSSEFDKKGTQRLIVEIFSYKPRVYDVILSDKTILNEVKKEGKSAGTFTLKLIEPSPVKRILYTESTNLQLSFNTPSSVIINIDGKAQQAKGDVSINTNLPIRPVRKNSFNGRNLVFGTSQPRTLYTTSLNESYFEYDMVLLEPNSEYTISFYHAFDPTCKGMQVYVSFKNPDQIVLFKELPPTNSQWGQKQVFQFTTNGSSHALCKVFVYNMGSKDGANAGVAIKELKIEKGNKATDWTPAPEDQHYISIAGNIDEITNLNTNAQILWEKL
ncbi:phage tail family protein [Elizabethkingia anophelis]|nr:phage tail family protein [Elizabethkingia anophelis]